MDVQGKNGLDIRVQHEKTTRIMSSYSWDLKKFKKCRPVLSITSIFYVIKWFGVVSNEHSSISWKLFTSFSEYLTLEIKRDKTKITFKRSKQVSKKISVWKLWSQWNPNHFHLTNFSWKILFINYDNIIYMSPCFNQLSCSN